LPSSKDKDVSVDKGDKAVMLHADDTGLEQIVRVRLKFLETRVVVTSYTSFSPSLNHTKAQPKTRLVISDIIQAIACSIIMVQRMRTNGGRQALTCLTVFALGMKRSKLGLLEVPALRSDCGLGV
jgi:hypothetical protein